MMFRVVLFLLAACVVRAGLPFKLPSDAEYSASEGDIAEARTKLATNLVSKPAPLTNLFAPPFMCGPGLWNILKNSPHFARRPMATSSTQIISGGKTNLAALALLQSPGEATSFRKALADLLATQGKLTIREPTQAEFMAFWVAIPMNTIKGPLLAAEGKDVTLFCHFENGKIFWADEVKRGAK